MLHVLEMLDLVQRRIPLSFVHHRDIVLGDTSRGRLELKILRGAERQRVNLIMCLVSTCATRPRMPSLI